MNLQNSLLQEEHPEDAVLGTTGAQAHVYASPRARSPTAERPLHERPPQERPHSDFVAREAAKEAAGLNGAEEKPGMCRDSQTASCVAAGASASTTDTPEPRPNPHPASCVTGVCPACAPLRLDVGGNHRPTLPTSCRACECSIIIRAFLALHTTCLQTGCSRAEASKLPLRTRRPCWPPRREPPWTILIDSLLAAFPGAEEADVQSGRTADRTRRRRTRSMWLYNEVRASSRLAGSGSR